MDDMNAVFINLIVGGCVIACRQIVTHKFPVGGSEVVGQSCLCRCGGRCHRLVERYNAGSSDNESAASKLANQ